ncbi:histone-lysine N-methyltransferase, H3 lysine-79 specific-like [Palaemon carinicauda]|uniref:histone-lysine N-methyltransferase, H3 lysine-79 specific-like n=1 Tax=Palaemon carinicauda TaxID=392227 RepID=UPI0035B5D64E
MNTEKERLEMSLTEAKMKNLTNEGNYTSLVNASKDTKKEVSRAADELSKALEEIGELKESMASIVNERDSLKECVCHLNSDEEMAKDRIVETTKENVHLKDERLATNEIISSFKEELERRDKKRKQNRHGTRRVRLNRSGLEILTEIDEKKDVQKDISVNKKEEDKVVKAAEDLDSNGHKEEKEVVGGPSGLGQGVSWLLASKGALPANTTTTRKSKAPKGNFLERGGE